jgi:SAM-dependent methyltransferase
MIEFSNSVYLRKRHIDSLVELYSDYNGDSVRNWGVNFIIEEVIGDLKYKYLDVLCGKNPMSVYLKKIGAKVVGLDGGKSAFSTYAYDKTKKTNYRGLEVYVSDSNKMPFEDDFFDVSYCMDIFRWFRKEQVGLKNSFCSFTPSDLMHCNDMFINTILEMCRVTKRKIIVVDRFFLCNWVLRPNPPWNMLVKALNTNGFETGILPPDYNLPQNKLVVDVVVRDRDGKTDDRRVSFYGIAVVGEKL